MSEPHWSAVDGYIGGLLAPADDALEDALRASEEAGLPPIQVSAAQGKMLHLLARSCQARFILEMGTLGGYSTIWLARALPAGGRLVTLESEASHVEVARRNIARAGFAEVVEVRQGWALELLSQLADERPPPFDLIFIDADKPALPEYFTWALRLSRPGSIIIADNVVRNGALADRASTDPSVIGAQELHEMLAREPRVSATTIQTVGCKGYDGFTFALVTH